ncbi:MAG: hypothetical protein ACKOCE_11235, partial [Acidimicrobiia bacterium]
DRERPGAYHQIAFARVDGGPDVVIDTTRPGVRRRSSRTSDVAVSYNLNMARAYAPTLVHL